jgi:ethanolamine ammonia-lyase large subunit
MRSHGGVTVQPALALQSVALHDLAVVPLLDTTIGIEWRLAIRDDPGDDVTDIATTIRSLVDGITT